MKAPSWIFVAVALLCAAPTVFAAEKEQIPLPGVLPNEVPVAYGKPGKPQSVQHFPNLVTAELPYLHTRLVYSRRGLLPPGTKKFVFMVPGSSGAVTSEFGSLPSLSPYVNEALHQKAGAVGIQLPIYWKSGDELARLPFVERYKALSANMQWLSSVYTFLKARMLGEILERLPEGTENPQEIAEKQLAEVDEYGIFRSTGAGLALSAWHDSALDPSAHPWIRNFTRILVMGVDGHKPEDIHHWHEGEEKWFFRNEANVRSGMGDRLVFEAGPVLFEQMRWQTDFVAPQAHHDGLPDILTAVGSRDEIAEGDPAPLFRPNVDFYRMHPSARMAVVWHDGYHDPGKSLKHLLPKDKQAGPMGRARLLVNRLLSVANRNEPGFRIEYFPGAEAAMEPLERGPVTACGDLLAGTAAAQEYPPQVRKWAPPKPPADPALPPHWPRRSEYMLEE